MARRYASRAARAKGNRPKFRNMTQSTPGGSYDGHPAEDDPRFNPRKDGNKRSGKRRTRGYKRPAFNQQNFQNV
jgi:hypothetical protein